MLKDTLSLFIDTARRYAYVAQIDKRNKARPMIQEFLSRVQGATGHKPRWLVSDNAGEYMAEVVKNALADMDITHIPAIPYNSEENGIAERLKCTVMNEVRTALLTTNMSWKYWTWALQDAVDKYNQLPKEATGCSPHETWFRDKKPDLRHLYIFGQLGFALVKSKATRLNKHNDRGRLVRYLGRDSETRVITEATDGAIH